MTTDNAPQMVRLTYLLPAKMSGKVFMVKRALAPAATPAPAPIAPPAPPAPAPTLERPAVAAEPPRVSAPRPSGIETGFLSGASRGNRTEVINVGLDLGRSETRIYDGEHLFIFPTLVGGPVATIRRGSAQLLDENLEQNLWIKVDGHEYSIGRYAMEQPFLFPVNEENIFQGELNKALVLTSLALLARRTGQTHVPRYKICLGLPVYLSRRPEYIDASLREWLGRHDFIFCGEPMSLEIIQIDTIPQPVGSVYAAILAGQLDYNPEETIGVVDPGHLTTDWVVVRLPNELTKYSGHTTAVAGYRLYEEVASYLSELMVPRINPMAVQESLITGVYKDNQGDTLAIPEHLVESLKEIMAQQIALTVKQSWRDLRVHRMLLVGGFGRILYPLLTKYPYFRDLQLAQDPRYYNVKGFFEYAIATPLREGG
ncbi:MAG: ParM/StbA family protein [Candidatus Sericytochromatia bacterium]|nr:ParM/StbA family protein [Candidatus Sericytochromatia bacterium]